MATLTGILYACLISFGLGWYFGYWTGNFSLLLFILTVVTGLYWMAERFVFLPRRRADARALASNAQQRRQELERLGIQHDQGHQLDEAQSRLLAQPWWLDWTAGLFPVIVLVFVLRSFLFEPFKIPSGSMIPTLEIGDLILVNKFHYGVRLPVINKKIIANNDPKRGDVMVFRYPVDPGIDFIKRVVGVPGDEVSYINQKLSLNGKPVELQTLDDYYDEDRRLFSKQFSEKVGSDSHRILVDPSLPSSYGMRARNFPGAENCRYSAEGVTCTVPPGHYFMMGDNRDNSEDSRYWGFVPDENIVGRAFFVWMNFGNLKRIGAFH
ncbi:signal peptidase I [Sphaerotilus hippei]|uniref:Signal peptidase I n=1 Tax=Sphaerotilus hippei TaxID=744406 RepID=A0A318H4Q8_9BURK|nr:signal peptidase I [Sphaerotilus hippei]PXW97036.1 signal peptidase I [Sphaerotilus hippei]